MQVVSMNGQPYLRWKEEPDWSLCVCHHVESKIQKVISTTVQHAQYYTISKTDNVDILSVLSFSLARKVESAEKKSLFFVAVVEEPSLNLL